MADIAYMDLEFIDIKLRKMLRVVEEEFGKKTITSLFRIDDPGVHGTLPLRGTDLRCRGWQKEEGHRIEYWVNSRYRYDPKRPSKKCCMFHRTKGGAFHLHLQVHPNTVRR